MADTVGLSTVYNHYMTAYAPLGSNTKYDTHKKSELRGVYNSIVKMNKESPLFLIDNSPATKEFAVNLKENARSLKNTISSLAVDEDNEMLSKKTVSSSDTTKATATLFENVSDDTPRDSIQLKISQLAGGQINRGNYLPGEEMMLEPDTYSFDIRSRDIDYEFQFNINEGDTNRDIEDKLARLINRSNIGIHANVNEDESGNVSLTLSSDDTGLKNGAGIQFLVSDDKTSKTTGAVDYFGLNVVAKESNDAEFSINGEELSSTTNHITINKLYDIDLKDTTSDDESISIGLKTDVESLTDNISHLIMGYNEFMQNTMKYLDSQPYSKSLVREMNSISSLYENELESIGLNIEDNGQISLDRGLIQQTADEDDAMERFDNIKKFATSVLDKANSVSLNPMQYAQKKVVAYKNPGHNFAAPYVTSNYSGMLFSSYC